MKKIYSFLTLIFIFSLLLCSCSNSSGKELIGLWEQDKCATLHGGFFGSTVCRNGTIEFSDDNTYEINGNWICVSTTVSGGTVTTYSVNVGSGGVANSVTEKNEVISFDLLKKGTWTILENGKLELTDNNGETVTTNHNVKGKKLTFTNDNITVNKKK